MSFWERVGAWTIAIAGIIEAVDGALRNAPALRGSLPEFPNFFSFAPLILVILAGCIFAGIKLGWLKHYADSAHLELRQNVAGRSDPDRVSYSNIWRYFILHQTAAFITPQGTVQGTTAVIFLTFEPYVKITNIRCTSPDAAVPQYEVKQFNQRFAVITFQTELPKGTLRIDVG
jgi:hypothetical protein